MDIARPLPVTLNLRWRSLLALAALGNLAVLASLVLAQRDLLSLALAGITLAGLALTRLRGGLLGIVVLGLVSADIAAYTLTGAVNNIVFRGDFRDLVTLALLACFSLAGIVAAAAAGLTRRQPEAGGPAAWSVGSGALALFVVLMMAGAFARQSGPFTPPAAPAVTALELNTQNMAFTPAGLEASQGQVTVSLANADLFWHTFTVDALGVDLEVPMGGERQVTFTAAPGTYAFYCAIPGHALIGMRGTLTVR